MGCTLSMENEMSSTITSIAGDENSSKCSVENAVCDELSKEITKKKKRNSKSKFKCLTGDEIYNRRQNKALIMDNENYEKICEQMSVFWEENDIEKNLLENGSAIILSKRTVASDKKKLFNYKFMDGYSKSSEDIENNIECGEYIEKNTVYMADNKYSDFWADVFENVYGIALDDFNKFMNDKGFYWNLGVRVMDAGRKSLLNHKSCIYNYEYVLYVACDADDDTVTKIRLGLESPNDGDDCYCHSYSSISSVISEYFDNASFSWDTGDTLIFGVALCAVILLIINVISYVL